MKNQEEFENVEVEEMNRDDVKEIEDKIVFSDEKKLFNFYEKIRCHCLRAVGKKSGKFGKQITELLLFFPDFVFLVIRLFLDKRTPRRIKIILGSVIGYLILPWDIIPDFIPVIGYIDDMVLVVIALNSLLNEIDPDIVTDNWSGKEKPLILLQQTTAVIETFLDKHLLIRLKKLFNYYAKKEENK
ncbi:MAG: YkvA family protein [Candidatus Zophobacter franzmannii]|jgi:uncharacterized membrane protein YkvA (DUF1232 family)|nr:YkvA family protein [Candidatus Zophobacter franzmannii]